MILYRLVGVLYLLSGVWCVFRPELAAAYVGFSWSQSIALAEFVAVYGGLQIGIALSVLYTSFSKHSVIGVHYTLILSVSLVVARLLGIWQHGGSSELLVMMLIEAAIVAMLLLGLRSINREAN